LVLFESARLKSLGLAVRRWEDAISAVGLLQNILVHRISEANNHFNAVSGLAAIRVWKACGTNRGWN
jgi:hypothetical protein